MRVYLAGGVHDNWRETCLREFGEAIVPICPLGEKEPKLYAWYDLEAIKACDVVLACMTNDNPSGFGMCLEIGFAKALGKRIIFVDRICDNRSQRFDIVRAIADYTTDNLLKACHWLNTLAVELEQ